MLLARSLLVADEWYDGLVAESDVEEADEVDRMYDVELERSE